MAAYDAIPRCVYRPAWYVWLAVAPAAGLGIGVGDLGE